MKVVNPEVHIMFPIPDDIVQRIERCGRICYKSEEAITADSANQFVRARIKQGHESILEHASITVKFVCDRGVSHELVRHRIASFSQESTRYCNYGGDDIKFITPIFEDIEDATAWGIGVAFSESQYKELIERGQKPQIARSVLPNSLKTEVIMTANIREWRTVFKLRAAQTAHPQMRQVIVPLLKYFKSKMPALFEDITAQDQPQEAEVKEAWKI